MKHSTLHLAMTAVVAACCGISATTQAAYPEQPVKLIAPFASDGPAGMGTSRMPLQDVRQFINRQFEFRAPAIKAMDLKPD